MKISFWTTNGKRINANIEFLPRIGETIVIEETKYIIEDITHYLSNTTDQLIMFTTKIKEQKGEKK